MRLPPVSKFSVISLLILSTTVAFYRYYTYFLIVSHVNSLNEKNKTNHTPEQIESGKAFPSAPSIRVPRPNEIYVPLLTLVPPSGTGWSISESSPERQQANGITFYPWVLITSSLVEISIIPFLLAFITLLYGARYCENVWGSTELARFLIIMAAIPNLFGYIFYTFMHWIIYRHRSANEDPSLDSFKETICGTTAVVAGFLVAFKQLVPEHMIVMFRGRIRLRVKRLPFLFLMTNTLAGILGYDLLAIMSWVGFFTSWVYLRFIRISYVDSLLPFSIGSASALNSAPNSNTTTGGANIISNSSSFYSNNSSNASGIKVQGDASDSFALSTFFPEPFSFIVEAISEHVFSFLVILHILNPFTPEEVDHANARAVARLVPGGISGPSSRTFHHNLPRNHQSSPQFSPSSLLGPLDNKYPRGSTRAEAERRRFLALRALGQDPLPPPLSAPNPVVLPAPRAGKD